jgi:hypothetical protein
MPNATNDVTVLCPESGTEHVEVTHGHGPVLTAVYEADRSVPELGAERGRLELTDGLYGRKRRLSAPERVRLAEQPEQDQVIWRVRNDLLDGCHLGHITPDHGRFSSSGSPQQLLILGPPVCTCPHLLQPCAPVAEGVGGQHSTYPGVHGGSRKRGGASMTLAHNHYAIWVDILSCP